MGYRLAVAVIVAVILSGCMQRVESLQIDTPSCPPVAIVVAGRIMNFYRVDLEIAGREPVTLVPNIDMPGDEPRYILGLRKSPDGVQIARQRTRLHSSHSCATRMPSSPRQ